MKEGDNVYFLSEYTWQHGVVKVSPRPNSKSVMIHVPAQGWWTAHDTRYKMEKVAIPGELVCVVEEYWKRGGCGYRIERDLYPEHRIPAENVHYQCIGGDGKGRVRENAYGVLV